MKVVKYLLLALFIILIWKRPFIPLHNTTMQPKALPKHVVAQLGSGSHTALQGIDISHYDGRVQFNEVEKSGIDFVYLKATQGTDFIDPTYHEHVEALQTTRLLHGAYHYFQPNQDPIAQAQFFVSQVQDKEHILPPMLDVEVSMGVDPEALQKSVQAWLAYIHKALNCRPVLYSYGDFWLAYLGENFNQYPFWLADYATKPNFPKGLKNWRLWQYTDKGQVPGIEGRVDRDVLLKGELYCHV